MGKNKRYYWLKLKKDFFDSKEMKKLRKLAGGDTFTIIYLKMQLLSLADEGKLYFDGVEDSFAEEIALQIDEEPENVKVTILYLQRVGLIEVMSDNELFLSEVPYMTGSETDKAEFMRKKRQKSSNEFIGEGNNVTRMLPEVTKCYTEIEKETDKDKEKEKETDNNMSTGVDGISPIHIHYQEIIDLFNSICVSLNKVRNLTDTRKKKIKSAYKLLNGDYEGLFKRVEESDFLSGRSGKWDKCGFDWIMKQENMVKILEGNYDNKGGNNNGGNQQSEKPKVDTSKMTFEELEEYLENGGTL